MSTVFSKNEIFGQYSTRLENFHLWNYKSDRVENWEPTWDPHLHFVGCMQLPLRKLNTA